eukprot:scaffold292776_cov38-Prasinocladus_malaysianus.AAC.1
METTKVMKKLLNSVKWVMAPICPDNAAAQVARVMCHVEESDSPNNRPGSASVPAKENRPNKSKISRNNSSAADLLREFTHPS